MPFLLGAIPWRLVAIMGLVAGLALGAMYVTTQLKKIGRLEAELTHVTATKVIVDGDTITVSKGDDTITTKK